MSDTLYDVRAIAGRAGPVHHRPMTAARFERITEAQRECLRLVLTRRNSKEIAQTLGIQPVTVDKRIGRAVATLGVSTRFEAARLLAEEEGIPAYQPLVYQPADIVPPADSDMVAASETLTPVGGETGQPAWLPIRPRGGRNNTLNVWQRLLWIFTIPAALAVAVGMLGFGLSVVGKILRVIGAVVS